LVVFGSELPPKVNYPSSITGEKPSPSNDDLLEWFTEVLHDGASGKTSQDQSANAAADENQGKDDDAKPNLSALLLALCGWSGEKVSDVPIATCSKCFTRLGFWLYQPKPASASNPADEDAMALDPVSLHRAYCPWQDPGSMRALGALAGLAGWQVLADAVAGQVERARRQRRRKTAASHVTLEEDDLDSVVTSRASREDLDSEDRARESKLARLRRAFAVKKGGKKA
jgi:Rsm1-like